MRFVVVVIALSVASCGKSGKTDRGNGGAVATEQARHPVAEAIVGSDPHKLELGSDTFT